MEQKMLSLERTAHELQAKVIALQQERDDLQERLLHGAPLSLLAEVERRQNMELKVKGSLVKTTAQEEVLENQSHCQPTETQTELVQQSGCQQRNLVNGQVGCQQEQQVQKQIVQNIDVDSACRPFDREEKEERMEEKICKEVILQDRVQSWQEEIPDHILKTVMISSDEEDSLYSDKLKFTIKLLEKQLHLLQVENGLGGETMQNKVLHLEDQCAELQHRAQTSEGQERQMRDKLRLAEQTINELENSEAQFRDQCDELQQKDHETSKQLRSLHSLCRNLRGIISEKEILEQRLRDKVEFLEKVEVQSSQRISELEALEQSLRKMLDDQDSSTYADNKLQAIQEKLDAAERENGKLTERITELEEDEEILRENWRRVAAEDSNRAMRLEEKVHMLELSNKDLRTKLAEAQDVVLINTTPPMASLAEELLHSSKSSSKQSLNTQLSDDDESANQTVSELRLHLSHLKEEKNAQIGNLQERLAELKDNEIKLSETLVEMEMTERELRAKLALYESSEVTVEKMLTYQNKIKELRTSQESLLDQLESLENQEVTLQERLEETERRLKGKIVMLEVEMKGMKQKELKGASRIRELEKHEQELSEKVLKQEEKENGLYVRISALMDEVQQHKMRVEELKKELEEREERCRRVVSLESKLLQIEGAYKEKLVNSETSLVKTRNLLAAQEKQHEDQKKRLGEKIVSLEEKLQAEEKEHNQRVFILEGLFAQKEKILMEKIAALEDCAEKNKKEVSELQLAVRDKDVEISNLSSEKDHLVENLKAEALSHVERFNSELMGKDNHIAELEENIIEVSCTVSKLSSQLAAKESVIAGLEKELKNHRLESSNLQQEFENKSLLLNQRVNFLEIQLEDKVIELAQVSKKEDEALHLMSEYANQLQEMKTSKASLQAKLEEIEEQKEALMFELQKQQVARKSEIETWQNKEDMLRQQLLRQNSENEQKQSALLQECDLLRNELSQKEARIETLESAKNELLTNVENYKYSQVQLKDEIVLLKCEAERLQSSKASEMEQIVLELEKKLKKLNLEISHAEKKNHCLEDELKASHQTIQGQEEHIAQLTTDLQLIRTEAYDLRTRLTAMIDNEQTNSSRVEDLLQQKSELKSRISDLEVEISGAKKTSPMEHQEQIRGLKRCQEELEKEMSVLHHSLDECQHLNSELHKQVHEQIIQIKYFTAEISVKELEFQKAETNGNHLQQELEKEKNLRNKLESEICFWKDQKQEKQEQMLAENDRFKEKIRSLESQISQLTDNEKVLNSQIQMERNSKQEIQRQLDRLHEEINVEKFKLENEKSDLLKKMESLNKKVSEDDFRFEREKQTELQHLMSKITPLEKERDMFKQRISFLEHENMSKTLLFEKGTAEFQEQLSKTLSQQNSTSLQLKDLQESLSHVKQREASLQQMVISLEAKVTQQQEENSQMCYKTQAMEKREKELLEQMTDIEQTVIIPLENENTELKEELFSRRQENEALNLQLDKQEDKAQEDAEELSLLRQKVSDYSLAQLESQNKLDILSKDLTEIETEKKMLSTRIVDLEFEKSNLQDQLANSGTELGKDDIVESTATGIVHSYTSTRVLELEQTLKIAQDKISVLEDAESRFMDKIVELEEHEQSLMKELGALKERTLLKLMSDNQTQTSACSEFLCKSNLLDVSVDTADLQDLLGTVTQFELLAQIRGLEVENQKMTSLLEKISINEDERRQLSEKVQLLEQSEDHLMERVMELEESEVALKTKAERFQRRAKIADELEEELSVLLHQEEELKEKVESLTSENVSLSKKLRTLESLFAAEQTKSEHFNSQNEAGHQQILDIQKELKDTQLQMKEVQSQYELQLTHQEETERLWKTKLDTCTQREKNLRAEVEVLREEMNDVCERYKELEHENSSLSHKCTKVVLELKDAESRCLQLETNGPLESTILAAQVESKTCSLQQEQNISDTHTIAQIQLPSASCSNLSLEIVRFAQGGSCDDLAESSIDPFQSGEKQQHGITTSACLPVKLSELQARVEELERELDDTEQIVKEVVQTAVIAKSVYALQQKMDTLQYTDKSPSVIKKDLLQLLKCLVELQQQVLSLSESEKSLRACLKIAEDDLIREKCSISQTSGNTVRRLGLSVQSRLRIGLGSSTYFSPELDQKLPLDLDRKEREQLEKQISDLQIIKSGLERRLHEAERRLAFRPRPTTASREELLFRLGHLQSEHGDLKKKVEDLEALNSHYVREKLELVQEKETLEQKLEELRWPSSSEALVGTRELSAVFVRGTREEPVGSSGTPSSEEAGSESSAAMFEKAEDVLHKRIKDMEHMEKHLRQQLTELECDREQLHEIARKDKAMIHELNVRLRELTLQERNLRIQVTGLEENERSLYNRCSELEDKVLQLEDRNHELEVHERRLRELVRKLKLDEEAWLSKSSDLSSSMEQLSASEVSLRKVVQDLQFEKSGLSDRAEYLEARVKELENLEVTLMHRVKNYETVEANLQTRLHHMENSEAAAYSKASELDLINMDLSARLQQTVQENAVLSQHVTQQQGLIHEMDRKLSAACDGHVSLSQHVDSLQKSETSLQKKVREYELHSIDVNSRVRELEQNEEILKDKISKLQRNENRLKVRLLELESIGSLQQVENMQISQHQQPSVENASFMKVPMTEYAKMCSRIALLEETEYHLLQVEKVNQQLSDQINQLLQGKGPCGHEVELEILKRRLHSYQNFIQKLKHHLSEEQVPSLWATDIGQGQGPETLNLAAHELQGLESERVLQMQDLTVIPSNTSPHWKKDKILQSYLPEGQVVNKVVIPSEPEESHWRKVELKNQSQGLDQKGSVASTSTSTFTPVLQQDVLMMGLNLPSESEQSISQNDMDSQMSGSSQHHLLASGKVQQVFIPVTSSVTSCRDQQTSTFMSRITWPPAQPQKETAIFVPSISTRQDGSWQKQEEAPPLPSSAPPTSVSVLSETVSSSSGVVHHVNRIPFSASAAISSGATTEGGPRFVSKVTMSRLGHKVIGTEEGPNRLRTASSAGLSIRQRIAQIEQQLKDQPATCRPESPPGSQSSRLKVVGACRPQGLVEPECKQLKEDINKLEKDLEEKQRYICIFEKWIVDTEDIVKNKNRNTDRDIVQQLQTALGHLKQDLGSDGYKKDDTDIATLGSQLELKDRQLNFKNLEMEALLLEVEKWQIEYHRVEDMRKNALDALYCLETEVVHLQDADGQLKQLKEDYNQLTGQLEQVSIKCQDLKQNQDELEFNLKQTQLERDQLKCDLAKMILRGQETENKMHELEIKMKELSKVETEKSSLGLQVSSLTASLKERAEKLKAVVEENLALQDEIVLIQYNVDHLTEVRHDFNNLCARYDELAGLKNRAVSAVYALRAKINSLCKKCQQKDELLRRLREAVGDGGGKTKALVEELCCLEAQAKGEDYNRPLSPLDLVTGPSWSETDQLLANRIPSTFTRWSSSSSLVDSGDAAATSHQNKPRSPESAAQPKLLAGERRQQQLLIPADHHHQSQHAKLSEGRILKKQLWSEDCSPVAIMDEYQPSVSSHSLYHPQHLALQQQQSHGPVDRHGHCKGMHDPQIGSVPASHLSDPSTLNPFHNRRKRSSGYGARQDSSTIVYNKSPQPPHSSSILPQVLPPSAPRHLCVQKVEGDSLTLAWQPPVVDHQGCSNGSMVLGYRVYLNGRVYQQVHGPMLTCAQIHGVQHDRPQHLAIQTLAVSGLLSPPLELVYHADNSQHPGESQTDLSSILNSLQYKTGKKRTVVGLYDYNPHEQSPGDYTAYELPFLAGDILYVYGKDRPDGFYHGEVSDHIGSKSVNHE